MSNNKKQIIIKAPDGQVVDMEHFNKTNEVIFMNEQPKKIEFPKEWEIESKTYFYINDYSGIGRLDLESTVSRDSLRNSLPTKSLAEQMLVFTQLITMRERYREIERFNNPELGKIDWSSKKDKYCIDIIDDKLTPECYYGIHRTFSFQLEETRDEFLKHYSEDILYCKNLLG